MEKYKNIDYLKQAIKDKDYSVSGWVLCFKCNDSGDCSVCGGYSGDIEDTLEELVEEIERLEKLLINKENSNAYRN